MQLARSIAEIRRLVRAVRESRRSVGFVPTMGALHEGHLSLVEAARRDRCWSVVSIFVNPTQFAPSEDFARYPRDEAGDLALCEKAGVDAVFLPATDEVYPPAAATSVHVRGLGDHLCGPHRPGHFDGVATIVCKLFNMVQPDRAYFGMKDAQQLAIIRRMTADLDLPVAIIGCPTVREPDGLAMSSRNRYLTPDERGRALSLYRALSAAKSLVDAGERRAAPIEQEMARIIAAARPTRVDYITVVDAETLQPVADLRAPVTVALAVRFGATRLIDNLTLDPPRAQG